MQTRALFLFVFLFLLHTFLNVERRNMLNKSCVILIINFFFFINVNNVYGKNKHSNYTVCKSSNCKKFGNNLLENMNVSADPCDDFYNYVCGGWAKKHSVQKGYLDNYAVWHSKVIKRVIRYMKEPLQLNETVSFKKAKEIYRMCINQLDDAGILYLDNFLQDLSGWPIIVFPSSKWNSDRAVRWQDIAAIIHIYSHQGPFYRLTIEEEQYSRKHYITISQPEINDPDKEGDLLKNFIKVMLKKQRDVFAKFRSSIYQDISDVVQFMKDLLTVTEKETTESGFDFYEAQLLYDQHSCRKCSNAEIFWLDVARRAFPKYDFDDSTILFLNGTKYFENLGKILNKTPLRVIVNYVFWSFIRPLLKYISEGTRDLVDFPTGIINRYSQLDREVRCLDEPNLKHAIYYIYIKQHNQLGRFNLTRHVVEDIRSVLIQQISILPWIDKVSKRVLIKDMSDVDIEIGGPAWYTDHAIDDYYKEANVTPVYLETILSVLKLQLTAEAKKLEEPIITWDKREWYQTSPLDVSAIYDATFNYIRFTAGSLDALYFNTKLPLAANYGTLGYVAAHELIHGYDTDRQYDIYGDAWEKCSLQVYVNKTRCLVEQYKKFELPGLKSSLNMIDSELTLSENIADTGILAAYRAFKLASRGKKEVRIFNLEDYSAEQLFFISSARINCESLAPNMTVHPLIETKDIHAPGPLRVYGTLSNMPQFSAAFHCKKGSRMNPSEKCEIWDNNGTYWDNIIAQKRYKRQLLRKK